MHCTKQICIIYLRLFGAKTPVGRCGLGHSGTSVGPGPCPATSTAENHGGSCYFPLLRCLNHLASHFTADIFLVTYNPAFRPHQRALPLTAQSTSGPGWRVRRNEREEVHAPGFGEEAASASSSKDGHVSFFKYLSFDFFIYKIDVQNTLKLI